MIRISVVGMGYIGQEHARAIQAHPGAELALVVGTPRSAATLARLAAETGAATATDFNVAVTDPTIDVIYLCTPNRLHADQAEAALAAGKHVFCEKPLCTTLDDCRRLIAAVEQSGRQLMVGHSGRFQPIHVALKQMVTDGLLGETCFCEAEYVHDIAPFLAGGHDWWRHPDEGQFATIGGGCHPIDLLRWVVGEIEEVSAYGARRGLTGVAWDDTVVASLKFRSGALGRCLVSVGAKTPYGFNFGVFGSIGSVRNADLYLSAVPGPEGWMRMPIAVIPEHHTCAEELAHFLDCLKTGAPPLIDVRDGAQTVAVCLAIAEACCSGRSERVAEL
jgi:UDP-N-acetylglucosamine 3-dehydrogenase